MINYIIRRLLMVPLLLVGVTMLIFAMLQFLSPVERSALYIRDTPKNERQLDAIIRQYGLDKPIPVQYWNWLAGTRDTISGEIRGGVLRGDLGYSRTSSQPIVDLLKQRFPATLELALWSMLPVVAGGVILGVISAVQHNKLADQVARVFSIVGYSFPTFVFGLLVLMLFYANLKWFMPERLSNWANEVVLSQSFHNYTRLITIDSLLNGRFDIFVDAVRHLTLPVVTLAYLHWAMLLRVTRSSMLEVLRQDYITTARAKGLPKRTVVRKHALPNALMPVVTLGGATIVGLMSGVVITETVFEYPGIGSAAAAAALRLDVVTVLGFTLFLGFILVLANVVIDVLYAVIDPRVRLD